MPPLPPFSSSHPFLRFLFTQSLTTKPLRPPPLSLSLSLRQQVTSAPDADAFDSLAAAGGGRPSRLFAGERFFWSLRVFSFRQLSFLSLLAHRLSFLALSAFSCLMIIIKKKKKTCSRRGRGQLPGLQRGARDAPRLQADRRGRLRPRRPDERQRRRFGRLKRS